MTTNTEKAIGEGTGLIRPGTAVRDFATDATSYLALGLGQVISRLPLIDHSAIGIAKRIPEMNLLIASGSLSRKSFKENIDEYEAITAAIKEKKVDMGTYLDYQNKLLNIYHDRDYFSLLVDKILTEQEEIAYRNNKKTEFLSQLPQEPFQAINIKGFYPDMHLDSTLLQKRFKIMNSQAREKRKQSEEEYDAHIKSMDKIARPIFDERATKTEYPVVLYMPKTIDPEVAEIIDDKIKNGVLRTREDWDSTTWAEAMASFERIFPEQHKEEICVIQEEVKKGYYGTVPKSEMSTIVLQKLGLV